MINPIQKAIDAFKILSAEAIAYSKTCLDPLYLEKTKKNISVVRAALLQCQGWMPRPTPPKGK